MVYGVRMDGEGHVFISFPAQPPITKHIHQSFASQVMTGKKAKLQAVAEWSYMEDTVMTHAIGTLQSWGDDKMVLQPTKSGRQGWHSFSLAQFVKMFRAWVDR